MGAIYYVWRLYYCNKGTGVRRNGVEMAVMGRYKQWPDRPVMRKFGAWGGDVQLLGMPLAPETTAPRTSHSLTHSLTHTVTVT
jgi:hypothetical protein